MKSRTPSFSSPAQQTKMTKAEMESAMVAKNDLLQSRARRKAEQAGRPKKSVTWSRAAAAAKQGFKKNAKKNMQKNECQQQNTK